MTTENNFFTDQEETIINRLQAGLESIERDRQNQIAKSEMENAQSMRHQLSELLGRPVDSVPQHIIDGIGGVLSNWTQVRSNPLALQDLRARVLADITAAERADAERRAVTYTAYRLVRKDKTATNHVLSSSHKRSKLPGVRTYNDLPPVHLTALSKVEIASQKGFEGERQATQLLQNKESAKVLFGDAEIRGERVCDLPQVWDRLGYEYHLRPKGWCVVAIRRADGAIEQPTAITVDELHSVASTRLFSVEVKLGDSIVYSSTMYDDQMDAKYVIETNRVRYVKSAKTMLP